VDTFRLDVPNRNIEGLGFDDRSGLVLVSPKDITKGGPTERDERVLYAFDPKDPAHHCRAVLQLSWRLWAGGGEGLRSRYHGEAASGLKLRHLRGGATEHRSLLPAAVDERFWCIGWRAGRPGGVGPGLPKPEITPERRPGAEQRGKGRPVIVGTRSCQPVSGLFSQVSVTFFPMFSAACALAVVGVAAEGVLDLLGSSRLAST
jgi:hypothetical protein